MLFSLFLRNKDAFPYFICIASSIFYAWSGLGIYVLLVLCAAQTFWTAKAFERTSNVKFIHFGVATNIAILAFFKYTLFVYNIFEPLVPINLDLGPTFAKIVLPIGISFYVFQAVSYQLDVKKNKDIVERNFFHFFAYLAFFPQLIAGPIIRYLDIRESLKPKPNDVDQFTYGALRFFHGLFKKVVIADSAARIADTLFTMSNGEPSFLDVVLGSLAYAVQIYFDFSGYTDMAIGIAAMMGFTFKENFNRPYSSTSITDFWRRWHISLSSWFRDYLYIPLGGNRFGTLMTYRNLIIVFFVTGVWHGAQMTFVLWGLYHGLFLILERLTLARWNLNYGLQQIVRFIYVVPVVLVGWILFRAQDVAQFTSFMKTLANPFTADSFVLSAQLMEQLSPITLIIFCASLLVFFMPTHWNQARIKAIMTQSVVARVTLIGYAGLSAVLCAILVFSGSYSPFIYFQF